MNALKTTPLAALVALLALAGCDQRDDAAVITPAPGSTASAPGMSGDTGSMAPGGMATTPPASGPDTMTTPAKPGASAPAN